MECLGINPLDGTVYEGRLNCGFRTQPPPLLVPIEFVDLPPESKWKDPVEGHAHTIFREDSFDPVTRIRRGRVFILYDGRQKADWVVHDPFRDDLPSVASGLGMARKVEVLLYGRACLTGLRNSGSQRGPQIVVLGASPFFSLWSVLSVEGSVHGTPVLTLKAQRSFGTVPELDATRVPDEIRSALDTALDGVENSSHRQGAADVVDRCRGALSVVFGHLCGDRTLDLADSIRKARQQNSRPSELADWAGNIVARMHSRAKPNEQVKRGTRPVAEDDAQLALSCLGIVLREAGWGKAE